MSRGVVPVLGHAGRLGGRHAGVLAVVAASVAFAAFVALALPRYAAVQETNDLRSVIAGIGSDQRDLFADASLEGGIAPGSPASSVPTDEALAGQLGRLGTELAVRQMPDSMKAVVGPMRFDVLGAAGPLSGDGLAAPEQVPPHLALLYRSDESAHVRYVRGAAPAGSSSVGRIAIGVSAQVAAALHLDVGSVVTDAQARVPYKLLVTGIFESLDPVTGPGYWAGAANAVTAVLTTDGTSASSPRFWLADALVGPDELAALTAIHGQAAVTWQYPVRASAFDDRNLTALRSGAQAWNGAADPTLVTGRLPLRSPGPVGRTTLDTHISAFAREAQSGLTLASLGVGGLIVSMIAVLLLALRLLLERQREQLAVVRARGGAGWQVSGLVAVEVAAVAWPAAGAAMFAAYALTRGGGPVSPPVDAVVLVALLPFGVGLCAVREHRIARSRTRRERKWLPSVRVVIEALVAIVALAGWSEVRSRGVDTGRTGLDWLESAVPVLITAVAAIVMLRLYPLPIRVVARRAARRRGSVLFLGAAQAGRGTSANASAAAVLLLTVGSAVFGSVFSSTVDQGRQAAAWRQVGASVRVDATNPVPQPSVPVLDPGGVARLRHAPGVESVVDARLESIAYLSAGSTTLPVGMLAVDPAADADLIAGSPLRDTAVQHSLQALAVASATYPVRTPGDRLNQPPVPILVSGDLALQFASGDVVLTIESLPIDVRVVGVLDSVPGQTAGGSLVVLPWAAGATSAAGVLVPNVAWVSSASAVPSGALRQAIAADLPSGAATYQDDVYQGFGHSGSASVAQRIYLGSVVAEGVLCVAVLLLSLMIGAPARGRTLALLRTLGFSPRQARVLAVLETLPMVVAAAVAGTGVGLVILPLIRGSIDMSSLTGGDASVRQSVDAATVASFAVGVVLVAGGALFAETSLRHRTRLGRIARAESG